MRTKMSYLTYVLTFLKGKEVIVANAVIAILTIGGQQLFSFFTFSCPCHVGQNLIYGLAFLGAPALILLIVGYALNNQTWSARNSLLQCKLICLVLCNVTGRALVAPVTWLAVTLLNGSYYVCAMSEFVSVNHYKAFMNITTKEHKKILAAFPCSHLVPTELIKGLIRHPCFTSYYQTSLSQVAGWFLIAGVAITVFLSYCLARCLSPLSFLHLKYWASYVRNEQKLFEEAADLHSRLYATQHIKKFFGLVPGSKDLKEIRIPSCKDWRSISGVAVLRIVDEEHYDYSLLHDWALCLPTIRIWH
uniref:Calcium homeostasis modulator family member 4 n=1 Tax=Crocodylus porosus TaxID=8502 RepID=A0A7M4E5M6_CROPO